MSNTYSHAPKDTVHVKKWHASLLAIPTTVELLLPFPPSFFEGTRRLTQLSLWSIDLKFRLQVTWCKFHPTALSCVRLLWRPKVAQLKLSMDFGIQEKPLKMAHWSVRLKLVDCMAVSASIWAAIAVYCRLGRSLKKMLIPHRSGEVFGKIQCPMRTCYPCAHMVKRSDYPSGISLIMTRITLFRASTLTRSSPKAPPSNINTQGMQF